MNIKTFEKKVEKKLSVMLHPLIEYTQRKSGCGQTLNWPLNSNDTMSCDAMLFC